MARATTPQDLTITPRDRRFGRGMRQDRWWMGGDPVATAFYNALSATFPKGEAYFVESVAHVPRGHAAQARRGDQGLRHPGGDAQPRACPVQQARASRPATTCRALEARVEWRLSITRGRPPIVNLAATMALEHFTAILAHQLLSNPRHLGRRRPGERALCGAGTRSRRSSTRAVAYDTWLHATRGLAALASAGRSRPR